MELEVIITGIISTNCYILHDGKECVIIDAGDDFEKIKLFLEETGLKVKLILATHGHFDHIGAVEDLRRFTGAKFLIHEADKDIVTVGAENASFFGVDSFKTPSIDGFLKDGDILELSFAKIKVIHTPGHTRGGVSFLVVDEDILISGDTLFFESVGRTDFEYSSHEDLQKSIKDRLFELAGGTAVYPGHGRSTSIEHERRFNPYVSLF